DHRTRRPATARDRPLQSQRHPATVPALWSLGLSRQAVAADAARLGQSRPLVSAGSCRHVFAAVLYEGSQVLYHGPLRSAPTRQSVHPPGDGPCRAARGRGWLALPSCQLAPLARPPCLCPFCHDPELGRGGGKKRRRRAWTRTSLIGPWRIFRAMWPPMSSMTAPSAYSPRSITAATSASSMRSWITIPPTTTSGRFSGG